jgi:glycosyltransferase involved in cell wall biosynthesis
MSISIMVFAYNEEESLEQVIGELLGALNNLNQEYELVIINDGSTDGTAEIANRLANENKRLRVVSHPQNLGLGGVYRTGFKEAQERYVSFWPADGQFPASIIAEFLPNMTHADMVLGYLPDRDSPLLSKFLSFGERVLYRLLFGPIPRFQGVLMFERSLLEEVTLYSTGRGWGVLMEFIIKISRGGFRVRSVPTEMRPRMAGTSKVNNSKTVLANLVQAFELRKELGRP